jgi:hypothetical protein
VAANALSGFEFGAKVGENPRLLPGTKPEGDHFSAPRLSVELPKPNRPDGFSLSVFLTCTHFRCILDLSKSQVI